MLRTEVLLDEIARRPEPTITRGLPPEGLSVEKHNAVLQQLLDAGLVHRVGTKKDEAEEFHALYAPTAAGYAYWEVHLKGKRKVDPVRRHTLAQVAAASGPREVFELALSPWRWDKKAEDAAKEYEGSKIPTRSRPIGVIGESDVVYKWPWGEGRTMPRVFD